MTLYDKYNAVHVWQNHKFFHPLTCAVRSVHENLKPYNDKSVFFLRCPTCDNIQDSIPSPVFKYYEMEYKDLMKQRWVIAETSIRPDENVDIEVIENYKPQKIIEAQYYKETDFFVEKSMFRILNPHLWRIKT